jgi:hypothetical protein
VCTGLGQLRLAPDQIPPMALAGPMPALSRGTGAVYPAGAGPPPEHRERPAGPRR